MRALASTILVAVAVCAARTAEGREKVLKSLAVGKDGLRFQLTCDRCKKGKDCLSVAAVGKDAPAARLVLEEDYACRGNPDESAEYSAQEFRLTPALVGALFKEDAGGEAIAHTHWLVAIVDGKLRKLWGAMYSTQEVVSIRSYKLKITDRDGNGRQEIDYTAPFPVSNDIEWAEGAISAKEAGADSWEHQLVEFDDASKKMIAKTPHEEYAAVLSSTKTAADALKLKVSLLKNDKCAAKDFLVLDTETLPKLHKGFFVVAAIADSRAEAQAKLDRIKSCRPDISGAIRQVR